MSVLQMPAMRTRTRAQPGRNFGGLLGAAFNFPCCTVKLSMDFCSRYPAQCGSESGEEIAFLLGEDGAQVEQDAVFFNAGDYGNSVSRAAQALFQACGGIFFAGNTDGSRR